MRQIIPTLLKALLTGLLGASKSTLAVRPTTGRASCKANGTGTMRTITMRTITKTMRTITMLTITMLTITMLTLTMLTLQINTTKVDLGQLRLNKRGLVGIKSGCITETNVRMRESNMSESNENEMTDRKSREGCKFTVRNFCASQRILANRIVPNFGRITPGRFYHI